MKTTTALGLSSSIVVLLGAFTLAEHPAPSPATSDPSFNAEMHGDIHVSTRGEARFGVVEARDGTPTVFTLSLGGNGSEGAVLFTRINGTRFGPGTYPISDREDGSDDTQALISTGTATQPTGVFRGSSGYLIVTSASASRMSGRFHVEGRGFLSSDTDDETRSIRATGTFTATRQ